MKKHHYETTTEWTGNLGKGTADYSAYSRDHAISAANKATTIAGSSDPAFRGDAARYNPEDLLVSSLSACHMLWYLHLCATNGVVVVNYVDNAAGTMEEDADGSGRFVEVTLHPVVTITDAADTDKARELHEQAHRLCYIANSCHFPVKCECDIRVQGFSHKNRPPE